MSSTSAIKTICKASPLPVASAHPNGIGSVLSYQDNKRANNKCSLGTVGKNNEGPEVLMSLRSYSVDVWVFFFIWGGFLKLFGKLNFSKTSTSTVPTLMLHVAAIIIFKIMYFNCWSVWQEKGLNWQFDIMQTNQRLFGS